MSQPNIASSKANGAARIKQTHRASRLNAHQLFCHLHRRHWRLSEQKMRHAHLMQRGRTDYKSTLKPLCVNGIDWQFRPGFKDLVQADIILDKTDALSQFSR